MQPAAWRHYPWDGHIVLAHDSEQVRRDAVVAWVRRGLEVGAKVVYIERPDGPLDRSMMRGLLAGVAGGPAAVDSGQLEVVDSTPQAYDADWWAVVVDEALGAGYPAVRFSGEASTSWTVTSPLEHAEIERAADDLCRSQPVSMMCQYPAQLTRSVLESVSAVHSAGLRESHLWTAPLPSGLAAAGEVDICNEWLLHAALAATSANLAEGETIFVVDLSGLEFLDIAGARTLVAATADHRRRGGVVSLLAPQPVVERMLYLLGFDRHHGFILEGA